MNNVQIALQHFTETLGQLRPEDFSAEDRRRIYAEYRTVRDLCRITEVTLDLPIRRLLDLDINNEADFDRLIRDLLNDSQNPTSTLAKFIRSPAGFQYIHRDADFSPFPDSELERLFGSLFGAEIARACVESFRTEKIGRVLGYCWSGLFQQDYPKLKAQHQDDATGLVAALKQSMDSSDTSCRYQYQEQDYENISTVSCRIGCDEAESNEDLIDHCFINKNNGTITMGHCFGEEDLASAGDTCFQSYQAVLALTKQAEFQGQPNPYFGFTVKPYLLFSGRSAPEATPDANTEALAKLPYYRMLGGSVDATSAITMLHYNPFAAGCDTRPELSWNIAELAQHRKQSEQEQAIRQRLVSHLNKTIETIDLSSEEPRNEKGRKQLLHTVNDIASIGQSLFRIAGVGITHEDFLADDGWLRLHRNLRHLGDALHILARPAFIPVSNTIRQLSDQTASQVAINDTVENQEFFGLRQIQWAEAEEESEIETEHP